MIKTSPLRRAKLTWFITWLIIYLLLLFLLGLLTSCSHRTTSHIERTADTLIIHKTDSVIIRDTLKVISKMETTDSITDHQTIYVVVDSTGKVLEKYVYRDRQVYHNKDALSADHHVTQTTQKTQDTSHQSTARESETTKIEKPPSTFLSKLKSFIAYAFILGLIALIYHYIYKKK